MAETKRMTTERVVGYLLEARGAHHAMGRDPAGCARREEAAVRA